MSNLLIVLKRIKKAAGMRISDAFPLALSKEVGELIKKAASRAKANRRKTIQPQDL